MVTLTGTPEARSAWWHLRGPYLLAYLCLVLLSVSAPFFGPETYVWRGLVFLIAITCLIGSGASFLVAVMGKVSPRLVRVEVLEVTGLKFLVLVQALYGVYVLVISTSPSRAIFHVLVGALAAGALQALTWRGRSQKPGV